MATEEKAKAYDEALEKAKELLDSPRTCFDIAQLKGIFPELAESEDERIRKHLVEIVEIYWGKTNDPDKAKDLAWLEKQKESTDESDKIAAAYQLGLADGRKQKEQKPVDNDKVVKISGPGLFSPGTTTISVEDKKEQDALMKAVQEYYSENYDYITSDQPTLSIVTNIARHFYNLGCNSKPAETPSNLDELMDDYFENLQVPEHQIIFEDTFRKIAKDFYGYGISEKPNNHEECVPEIKETGTQGLDDAAKNYALNTAEDSEQYSARYLGYKDGAKWQKEQDDKELSEKIAAAYQLGRSDERKQKEQKPNYAHGEFIDDFPYSAEKENKPVEWSDEDETTVNAAIYWLNRRLSLEKANDISTDSCLLSMRKTIEKLKSLRPQPKQEWSEEDKIGWDEAFACVTRAEKAAKNEEELQNAVTAEKWLKEIKFKYYVHSIKQEWSELDRNNMDDLIGYLNDCVHPLDFASEARFKQRMVDWLKSLSLKKRLDDADKLCSNEWSEEDENMLSSTISRLYKLKYHGISCDEIDESIHWIETRLKSLRPHWRPSEEQMKALEETIDFAPESFKPRCTLQSLLKQLKAL